MGRNYKKLKIMVKVLVCPHLPRILLHCSQHLVPYKRAGIVAISCYNAAIHIALSSNNAQHTTTTATTKTTDDDRRRQKGIE